MQLDTRLPLAAIGERINPAGIMQHAEKSRQQSELFRQKQQSSALQQRLDELRDARESDLLARRQRAGRRVYSQIQQAEQGQPAQFEPVPMNQGPVINQPAYGEMRETSPAVAPREMTPEEIQQQMARALFSEGDYEGAFEAMKAGRSGQASQAKPFGAETKTGPDGMEYALNLMTGRYESTGFKTAPEQPKRNIVLKETGRGIEVIDLSQTNPGTVLPAPAAAPRQPRTQIVQDETGTYLINLDKPSAPAVTVTKPDGSAIVKPPAGGGLPTEDERKAAGWLAQAEYAWNNMSNIIKKNPRAIEQGLMERIVPEGVANVVRSEDRQMFLQGARSLSEAALRAATGAGVNYEEARQKIEEITPVYGDKPAVIKQKLDSVKVYLDSLKSRAGRALPKQDQSGQSQPQRKQVNILPPASQLPGKIATDNTTGIRYKSDGTKWVRIP